MSFHPSCCFLSLSIVLPPGVPPFPDSLYLSVHLSTPSAPPSALPHPLVVKSIPLSSRALTPFCLFLLCIPLVLGSLCVFFLSL